MSLPNPFWNLLWILFNTSVLQFCLMIDKWIVWDPVTEPRSRRIKQLLSPESQSKAQPCTTVVAAITGDYFGKRKDAAAASAMPATHLKWPASFARGVTHPGRNSSCYTSGAASSTAGIWISLSSCNNHCCCADKNHDTDTALFS